VKSLTWPLAVMAAAQVFLPARLRTGSAELPVPPHVVAGGEVLLEVAVGGDGAVAHVTTLRDTPPFTDMLRRAVEGWRFEAATEDGRARAWPILVAGIFRPPALAGPVAGTPPRDLVQPCGELPVPVALIVPPYPPAALGDGHVLIEATVGSDGTVEDARFVEGAAPFAQAALGAARETRFRPACRQGRPLAVAVYLVFGFRSPVTPPPPSR
jgi:TonB family protein